MLTLIRSRLAKLTAKIPARLRLPAAAGLGVILIAAGFWLSRPVPPPIRPLVWKGFVFASPSRSTFRTSLTLTRNGADPGGGEAVSGVWRQESWNGAASVDRHVHGVLSPHALSLAVDSADTNAPTARWCSNFQNLTFLRMPFGDLATAVNEDNAGAIRAYPKQTADACERLYIDLFDISRPGSLATADAAIAANDPALARTDKPLELYKQAATERARAGYLEGIALDGATMLGPDHLQAVAAYAQAAKLGYTPAKHLLGCMQPASQTAMMAALKDSFNDPKTAYARRMFDLFSGGQTAKYEDYPYPTFIEVPDANFLDNVFYCHVVYALGPKENALATILNPELNKAQKAALNALPLDAWFSFEKLDRGQYRVSLIDPGLSLKYTETVENPFGAD